MQNIKDSFILMMKTYENLIEQCFNTGLMRVEMDKQKGKVMEFEYISQIEKLNHELKKRDLRIDQMKKQISDLKLEKQNLQIKTQSAINKA